MTKKFEIYVGTEFDKHGKSFPVNIDQLENLAMNYFRGYSRHYVEGGYRHDDGREAREQSVCFVVFAEDPHFVRIFAADCKILFSQESVCLVNPDNSVEFI